MQGRQGQGSDPLDRSSSDVHAAVNGTGKQRAIPKRPPGMTRIAQPPPTRRVNRPQRQAPPPKSRRRRLLVFGLVFLGCGLLAGIIGFALVNLLQAIGNSSAAANTAAEFLQNLNSQNYDQAYNDLDAKITISLTRNAFKQMALADDHCYGQVTDYREVAGSATTSADNNTQGYTYDITRNKLSKTYKLTLTIQKDLNSGNWYITNYGVDLGPAPPTCR